ncbi:hypothetical protein M404DRAFT_1008613 [Pisolithus tinctorius Marx 270]|uniref:Uncharacterized protein n=1 Tax=Pisolithus tinctorius Marx 270 TaxID=870435 RepID=A0A0C3NEU9_PISTI|nr:hypothetical protein M404DRAFT_1008613 [Pisolithus tinctorius Marx 270]
MVNIGVRGEFPAVTSNYRSVSENVRSDLKALRSNPQIQPSRPTNVGTGLFGCAHVPFRSGETDDV